MILATAAFSHSDFRPHMKSDYASVVKATGLHDVASAGFQGGESPRISPGAES